MKVYPLGYARHAAHITSLMAEHERLVLIDTRYKPWSQMPAWRGEALKEQYTTRYRWAGEYLGNLNYKSGGPIQLADPATGLRGLRHWLEHGYDLLLLCGCAVYERCHLHTIVEALRKVVPAVEVVLPQEQASPESVKCLSVQQPYAHLIIHADEFDDGKRIENRTWNTSYRGSLLIHAGQHFDPYALPYLKTFLSAEDFAKLPQTRKDYDLGGIIGAVRMTDILTTSESRWFRGPYGWQFEQARALPFFPLLGSRGLFDVHPEVLKTLKRESEASRV